MSGSEHPQGGRVPGVERATPPVHYFDGRSSRAHAVRLRVADGRLHVDGDGIALALPLRDVQWPERTQRGPRIAHLKGGGSLQCSDGPAWDAWARAAGLRDSLVVRAQLAWPRAVAALAVVVLLLAAGYFWGVPAAARAALAFVPETVDRELGDIVLDTLARRGWLAPSERPAEEQERLRAAFARAVAAAEPAGGVPRHEVRFHKSRLGPNALALPGGVIVVTDDMVALTEAREDMLVGVLAHELGHVRHRHGMRLVAQAALVGVMMGAVYGDFSSLLAGVPALLGHLAYSRDFEREADLDALRVLKANAIEPTVMAQVFERLSREQHTRGRPPIALSSHPRTDERVRLFGGTP